MSITPDELQHQKWCLIADKILRDQQLLEIPLSNIERWMGSRTDGVDMLRRWKQLIEAALETTSGLGNLIELLRSDDEPTRHLKSYSPFPGVLTTAEVDRFTCSWRH